MTRTINGKYVCLTIIVVTCFVCLRYYLEKHTLSQHKQPRQPTKANANKATNFLQKHKTSQGQQTLSPNGQPRQSSVAATINKTTSSNLLLKNLRTQGKVHLPSKTVLKTMSSVAIQRTYSSYLDNVDIICERKLRMGRIGDGGWEICDDEAYRPNIPCLVYSFGINNDFSFDDYTANVYQCQVFSFDPSMNTKTHKRTERDYFLQIGISGRNFVTNKKWKMLTLQRSKELLNHTGRIIDVLKMDVESSEWDSLGQMIQSGEMRLVRQFLVEYHGTGNIYNQLVVLKDLYDLGFRKFYSHKNPACGRNYKNIFPMTVTRCYEVHYVNINKPHQ